MSSWVLADHGDRIERTWGDNIIKHFPLYQTFWVLHIVPLTYRVSNLPSIYVRSTVPEELRKLATASYGVFIHLAACHQQLASDLNLFAAEGIYTFYSRLYSAGKLVEHFLAAVCSILRKYKGTSIPKRKERRLLAYGAPELSERFDQAFTTRTRDYRTQQVHGWGFPVIGEKIPKREYFSQWEDKDLGELDIFLRQPDADARFAAEFVNAIQQAREDLEFVERVTNEVWQIALNELNTLQDIERYKADQNVGANEMAPARIRTTTSLYWSSSSG